MSCNVNFVLTYGVTQAALHRPVITLNMLSSTVFMSSAHCTADLF